MATPGGGEQDKFWDPVLKLMLCSHPLEILNCFALGPANYTAGPAEGLVLPLMAMDLGLLAEPGFLKKFSPGGLARPSRSTLFLSLHHILPGIAV